MLGGVQFETGGVGPVPYLNILGGTSQKKHPVVAVLPHLLNLGVFKSKIDSMVDCVPRYRLHQVVVSS